MFFSSYAPAPPNSVYYISAQPPDPEGLTNIFYGVNDSPLPPAAQRPGLPSVVPAMMIPGLHVKAKVIDDHTHGPPPNGFRVTYWAVPFSVYMKVQDGTGNLDYWGVSPYLANTDNPIQFDMPSQPLVPIHMTGRAIDSQTGQGIPNATILLWGGSLTGNISDSSGYLTMDAGVPYHEYHPTPGEHIFSCPTPPECELYDVATPHELHVNTGFLYDISFRGSTDQDAWILDNTSRYNIIDPADIGNLPMRLLKHKINGRVVDSGSSTPLGNIVVQDVGGMGSATTDASGSFSLWCAANSGQVQVSIAGNQTASNAVSYRALTNQTISLAQPFDPYNGMNIPDLLLTPIGGGGGDDGGGI